MGSVRSKPPVTVNAETAAPNLASKAEEAGIGNANKLSGFRHASTVVTSKSAHRLNFQLQTGCRGATSVILRLQLQSQPHPVQASQHVLNQHALSSTSLFLPPVRPEPACYAPQMPKTSRVFDFGDFTHIATVTAVIFFIEILNFG